MATRPNPGLGSSYVFSLEMDHLSGAANNSSCSFSSIRRRFPWLSEVVGGGGVKVICRYEVMKSCDHGRPFGTSYYCVLHSRSFCALSVDKAIDIDYDK